MQKTKNNNRAYTIKEAAQMSGLPESTLRYYETIGIIKTINRDSSSKHRVYNEDDINLITGIGCLAAIGLSLDAMRDYLQNTGLGKHATKDQISLLIKQKEHLIFEARRLKLRRQYLDIKLGYWEAISKGNTKQVKLITEEAWVIAKKLISLKDPISGGKK